MYYPFMTLNDETAIVHSEPLENNEVEVRMERPADTDAGFDSASCFLPSYRWENIVGFSDDDIKNLQEIIESEAHLIIRFAGEGGFEHAANF